MQIVETVLQDNEKLKVTLNVLAETEGESKHRKRFFNDLKQMVNRISKAKSVYFYRPLVESSETAHESLYGISFLEYLSESVNKLDEIDMSNAQWLINLKKTRKVASDFLNKENHNLLPKIADVLATNEQETLAKSYKNVTAH